MVAHAHRKRLQVRPHRAQLESRARAGQECGPNGCISEKTMNLRTWVRVPIAIAIAISGLVETLGATGLVV